MFAQWFFITGRSVTIIALLTQPKTALQMNEMKLNKFMIFVRYTILCFSFFPNKTQTLE